MWQLNLGHSPLFIYLWLLYEMSTEVFFDVYYFIIDTAVALYTIFYVHISRAEEQVTPKLDYNKHNFMNGLANILFIRRNAKFGRFVTVTEDVDVGKVIVSSKAFASIVYHTNTNQEYCLNCKKVDVAFLRCIACHEVNYCSKKCQDEDKVHVMECGTPYQRITSPAMKLVIQMILTAMKMFPNVDSMRTFVQRAFNAREDRGSWDQIVDDIEDIDVPQYLLMLSLTGQPEPTDASGVDKTFVFAMSMPIIKQWFDDHDKRRFLHNLIRHHIAIVRTNSFEDAISQSLREYYIYDSLSLFSHSCAANALYHRREGVGYCQAVRPIKKGEQVFINYLGSLTDESTAVRRIKIYRNWGFACECERCKPGRMGGSNVEEMRCRLSYKYVRRHMGDQYKKFGCRQRLRIASECKKLLNTYGHIWSDELQDIMNCYTYAIIQLQ